MEGEGRNGVRIGVVLCVGLLSIFRGRFLLDKSGRAAGFESLAPFFALVLKFLSRVVDAWRGKEHRVQAFWTNADVDPGFQSKVLPWI